MAKALVTGATRGPGRAIASALAQAGHETCALGRDRVMLEELRSDFGVVPMAMDLTDRDTVRLIVEGMKPEVIVHAALRWPGDASFLHFSEADIDMALEVNISATLHLTRAILPAMMERGQGAVLVVTPGGEAGGVLERTVSGAGAAFVAALQPELAGSGVLVRHLVAGEPPFGPLARSVLSVLEEAGMAHARL